MDQGNGERHAFESALADLEENLRAQRWDQAGEAGEALAKACESCRLQGVMLTAEDLRHAKALYESCLLLALSWGDNLNQEAQSAGSSQRAFHTYSQG